MPLTPQDEVVAFAVLLAECFLADCYWWRGTWKEIVSNPPTYDGNPRKFL